MTTTTLGATVWTEDERVIAWRIERLMRAGYEQHAAIELAEQRGVDVHLAQRLRDQGCSIETALRILL